MKVAGVGCEVWVLWNGLVTLDWTDSVSVCKYQLAGEWEESRWPARACCCSVSKLTRRRKQRDVTCQSGGHHHTGDTPGETWGTHQPQCQHTRQNRHNTGHTNPPQPGSHASLQSPQSCTASNIAAHYTVTTNSPHSASLSTADIYRSILKPVSSFTPSGPFPVTLTIHFCSFSVWNPNSPVRIIVNLLIYSFLFLSLLGLTTLNLSHFKFYLLSFLSFPD